MAVSPGTDAKQLPASASSTPILKRLDGREIAIGAAVLAAGLNHSTWLQGAHEIFS
jgi:hypothetical protein